MAGIPLHYAVAEYLDALRREGVPATTIKTYGSILHRLARANKGRQYRSTGPKELASFLYGPRGISVGRAPSTGVGHRAALRSFYAYGELMGWGKAPAIPVPVIRQRKPRPDTRPTRLPADALVRLLEACTDSPREIVLRGVLATSINTAWRISDLMKIKTRDLGLATGDLWFVSQKTGKPDAFPITADLDEEIRNYLLWYTETTGATMQDEDAYLFPGWKAIGIGEDGKGIAYEPVVTRHASLEWARLGLKDLFDRCGITTGKGEAWHTIRRSVARIYFDSLRNEISYDHALRQTAALLQHDSVMTTEKYLGLDAEVQARDASLKGKPFIGIRNTNVVQLKRQAH